MLAIRCCDQFTSSGLVVDFLNLAMISSVPPSATPPAAAWGEGQGHEGYAIGQPKVKLAQAEAEAARVRQPRHRLGEGGSFTPPLAPCHLAHTAWYSPMHAMGSIPPRVRRVLCTTSWCPCMHVTCSTRCPCYRMLIGSWCPCMHVTCSTRCPCYRMLIGSCNPMICARFRTAASSGSVHPVIR